MVHRIQQMLAQGTISCRTCRCSHCCCWILIVAVNTCQTCGSCAASAAAAAAAASAAAAAAVCVDQLKTPAALPAAAQTFPVSPSQGDAKNQPSGRTLNQQLQI
jgi:hypothetical protein